MCHSDDQTGEYTLSTGSELELVSSDQHKNSAPTEIGSPDDKATCRKADGFPDNDRTVRSVDDSPPSKDPKIDFDLPRSKVQVTKSEDSYVGSTPSSSAEQDDVPMICIYDLNKINNYQNIVKSFFVSIRFSIHHSG